MSMYNSLFGYNRATVLLAPMLTDNDPRGFFPRFRDCFPEDGNIVVYTRVGGGNRTYGTEPPHECMYDDDDFHMEFDFGEDRLYALPTFIETYDDDFDSTYGYYVFGVPEEWADDYRKLIDGKPSEISDAYAERISGCFGIGLDDLRGLLEGMSPCDGYLGGAPDWNAMFERLESEIADGEEDD